MPSTGSVRTQMLRRIQDLLRLDEQFEDIQIDVGMPALTWQDTSRYIVLARVTGALGTPVMGRPNPSIQDDCSIEIWCQAFGELQLDTAQVAEDTATMVVRTIARSRQLGMGDGRLDGVQTSKINEYDGPMFMRTDQGYIVSFRMTIDVITRIRTDS